MSQLVRSLWSTEDEEAELVPQSLNLSTPRRELLKKGVCLYTLPGQKRPELCEISSLPSAFEKYVSPEILKVCYSHICDFVL